MSNTQEQGATNIERIVDEQTHMVSDVTIDGAIRVRSMNIVERMALVMRDVEHVGKTGDNREQHYKFRPIDEFMNALHTPLVRHEVVVTPRVLDRTSFERDRFRANGQLAGVTRVVEMLVEFTFHAPDGTTLVSVTAGEGADVADKATNKAMAGALKYAIMQTFMVPTRELNDGDAETPELPSASPAAQQQQQAQADAPPRDEVMHALDEACEALGQTRAKVTEKWRATYDVGPVKNLDDEEKVPTWALHRFVLSLQPYVAQARARALAAEQEQSETPVVPDVTCAAVDEQGARCVRPPEHDGEHSFWAST